MSNFLLNMVTIFVAFMGEPNSVPLTQYVSFQLADSDAVHVPDNAAFSGLTPMTAMIYTNANGTTEDFIKGFLTHSASTGDNRSWRIVAHPTNGLTPGFFLNENGTASPLKQYAGGAVLTGGWHQLAFTFAANDLKLYVDGILSGATIINDDVVNSLFDSTASLEIGSNNSGAYFTGGVTQAAVWNKVLSAAEIGAIYSSFNPGPSGTTMNLKKDQGSYAGATNLRFWARLGNGDTVAANGFKDSSTFLNHGSPVATPTLSNF